MEQTIKTLNWTNLVSRLRAILLYLLNKSSGETSVTTEDITDATALGRTVLTATDEASARTAIGAGTSNLTLGSTGTTAAFGNHSHTATQVNATAVGTGTATNVQGILAELEARITALESA